MTPTHERVCIIGAGPVGLGVARALSDAGVPYDHLEATDHVGGNWAHGVYETAHIISSRKTTEYADWPMPSDWPDFPGADLMCRYYNDYADAHGLRERITFESPVTRVEPDEQGWLVTAGQRSPTRYKAVAVCNGHHWDTILPEWTRDFEGQVLHSKQYKRPEQLAGKRILAVGGGNSGCDLLVEASRVGARADWSLRRGYHFLPKTLLGVPTVELMKPWMPVWAQRILVRSLVRLTVGRYERYGLPEPDHRLFDAHPTLTNEMFHALSHGRATVRPDVQRVQGQTVHFVDGTSQEYDLIACGTGYRVSFPFLPQGLVPIQGKTPQVLGGMLVPGQRHLYIVGAFQPRYGLGPLVTPAARLLAHWVQLQDTLDVPLADALVALGQRPPDTHLVDPHAAIRQMRRAMKMDRVIRLGARRVKPSSASAVSSAPSPRPPRPAASPPA